MFSKSRVTENPAQPKPATPESVPARAEIPAVEQPAAPAAAAPRQRTAPSVLSADLTIKGDLQTAGDVQIEGNIDGDIRARQLTIGETATVRGEVLADEVIVNGRVVGRLRGLKVRLTSTARVEGDIIHKTIAIESGAHFEGSVQRQEDPLANGRPAPAASMRLDTPAPAAGDAG